jgi:hypothetical protein
MRFARASFYDAPFPSDDLLGAGSVSVAGFPNPGSVSIVEQARTLVAGEARAFSEDGGIYFSLTGPIDPSALPDLATSVTAQASVFLLGVTQAAPDYGKRYPVTVRFDADGGPFGAPSMITVLPLQGVPLRPRTTYAAVVTRAAGVVPSADMMALAAGQPAGLSPAVAAEYGSALAAVAAAGVGATDVAGIAVFTTDDPTAGLAPVLADMLSLPLPQLDAPLKQTDMFPGYCVYEGTLPMPDYQSGSPPYDFGTGGGTWQTDPSGKPVLQRTEDAGVVITIPRTPMPSSGWPIVHFLRTGGGGNRPLVDRGAAATNGGPAIMPGSGPAMYFAMAGLAGASVDGPHEGTRNLTNGNEDFLIFNVFNPAALRDNIRESAVEYALFAHVLAGLSIDVSDCPGTTSPATFDGARVGLMGHSMGATIAPLTLFAEPMYRAAVLSGAGASWIENVIWKQQPLDVEGAFNVLLGYTTLGRSLAEDDPVLSFFQWAEEPADPLVYARALVAEPPVGQSARHVLMEQGIVDHYILPDIANALSLPLTLDLAEPPLDATSSELQSLGTTPLEAVLPYSGRSLLPLPISANHGSVTAAVVQHPSDGIEDGHEVVFQTDPPKREYRCFLQTWAAGQAPVVPAAGAVDGGCE